MICKNCGYACRDDLRFCPNCGTELAPAPNSYQQQAAQNPYEQQPPYGQTPYGQYPYGQYPNGYMVAPGRGQAIASLVLGILSFFLFPLVTGILAIVFGGIAKSRGSRSPMATAGLVCGILGIVSWILMLAFF